MMLIDHAKFHIALLGPREYYCIVAKNHENNKVETKWLRENEIIPYAMDRNNEGYTVWISLNDKEYGEDTVKGVKALNVLWFDIDSERPDKNIPASKEELQEALNRAVKLLNYIQEEYGAIGYLGLSGNGFHLHFPLPHYQLIGVKFREEVNEKYKAFAKKISKAVGVKIDKTYDLRRVTTLIGSYNLKIPDKPLQTRWDKDIFKEGFENAMKNLEHAREVNQTLLEAILDTEIYKATVKQDVKKQHPKFNVLLKNDVKLRDLYNGDWGKYGYPTRSEAEEGLLVKLIQYGFSDQEILEIMNSSGIGKWVERPDSYRTHSLKKAHEYIKENPTRSLSIGKGVLRDLRDLKTVSEVSETFRYVGDKPFKGRVQLAALGYPMARFTKLTFKCNAAEDCKIDSCPLKKGLVLSLDDECVFDPSALATYFDTNNPLDALNILFSKYNIPHCSDWRKKVVYAGENEKAITKGIVHDLSGSEGHAWFIHGEKCDLSKAPNWIIAEGYLCKGRRGRIGILILGFTQESEVLEPPKEDVEHARSILKKFSSQYSVSKETWIEDTSIYKIADMLRRKVNAKGDQVTRGFISDLLTIASPVWVKTIEAEKELGATTCELGPSTNYKSQRAKFLKKWIGAGQYIRGRKTEAGLTVGLEKVEGIGWVARKGALPSADLSYIYIDNMPPHALDEQIESRRDGIVSLLGIKQVDIWSRSRLKLLSNPLVDFNDLVFKCVALKMYDPRLIARMTFAIFTYGVEINERYDSVIYSLSREDEEILNSIRTVLRWNLSKEIVYEVDEKLWPLYMDLSKELEEKFGVDDISLLHRNIPYKIAVLSYSFALLEGYEEPEKRHVYLAYRWLYETALDIQLNEYVENKRRQSTLTDEEYQSIKGIIKEEMEKDKDRHGGNIEETYIYKMLKYMVEHESPQRDEIAAYLDVSDKVVKEKVRLLKGLELIRSSRKGYNFTAKGVRFIRRWFEELNKVPKVPYDPNSRGQTQVEKNKFSQGGSSGE